MPSLYRQIVPGIILPFYDRLSGRRFWDELQNLRRLQWRSSGDLEERAAGRMKSLLVHAGRHVPYYRDLFSGAGIDLGKIARTADLELLPVTTKAQLRLNFPARTLADNLSPGRFYMKRTSGSTGLPLEFFADRAGIDLWMGSYLFFREWADAPLWLTRLHILAPPHFCGYLKNEASGAYSPGRSRLLRRWLLGEKVVSLSGIDLTLREFLFHIRHAGSRGYFLHAFPSYAAHLAMQVLDSGTGLPSPPRSVICYAETLTPSQQALIGRAFGCRVANQYSALEVLHMAQTCPDYPAFFHVNSERAILRVVRQDGKAAQPGERGRIIVTDLANKAMPFINYDTGDWGVAGPPCPCGRGFPTLAGIEGRESEFLRTPAGRIVSPGTLGSFFMRPGGAYCYLWEYQAIQTATDSVTLLIVPTPSFSAPMSNRIARDLEAWLGPGISVTVALVDRIDAEPSGKRPMIKSGPASGQTWIERC